MSTTTLENSLSCYRHPEDAFRVEMVQRRDRVEHQKSELIQAQYVRHASGLQVNAVWCELFRIPGEAGHDTSDSRARLPTWGRLREAFQSHLMSRGSSEHNSKWLVGHREASPQRSLLDRDNGNNMDALVHPFHANGRNE